MLTRTTWLASHSCVSHRNLTKAPPPLLYSLQYDKVSQYSLKLCWFQTESTQGAHKRQDLSTLQNGYAPMFLVSWAVCCYYTNPEVNFKSDTVYMFIPKLRTCLRHFWTTHRCPWSNVTISITSFLCTFIPAQCLLKSDTMKNQQIKLNSILLWMSLGIQIQVICPRSFHKFMAAKIDGFPRLGRAADMWGHKIVPGHGTRALQHIFLFSNLISGLLSNIHFSRLFGSFKVRRPTEKLEDSLPGNVMIEQRGIVLN